MLERGVERLRPVHQMVGGADPEHGVAPDPRLGVEGCQRDRRGGVAPDRLEQPVPGERRIDRLELAPDQEVLRLGADRDHPVGARAGEQAARGLLEQRPIAHQLARAAWAGCRG